MTVSKVKELQPLADVVELRPDAKYVVMVTGHVQSEALLHLQGCLAEAGIARVVLLCVDTPGAVQIFELE